MNLYRISQVKNQGYDTYDSAVVVAPDEDAARHIHPSSNVPIPYDFAFRSRGWDEWCPSAEHVHVTHIGVALSDLPAGVVCASFNAG